jgi:hypothetical protein
MKRGEVKSIDRPEPSFLKDFFNFIDKKVSHEYSIVKGMLFGTSPLMSDFAKIE